MASTYFNDRKLALSCQECQLQCAVACCQARWALAEISKPRASCSRSYSEVDWCNLCRDKPFWSAVMGAACWGSWHGQECQKSMHHINKYVGKATNFADIFEAWRCWNFRCFSHRISYTALSATQFRLALHPNAKIFAILMAVNTVFRESERSVAVATFMLNRRKSSSSVLRDRCAKQCLCSQCSWPSQECQAIGVPRPIYETIDLWIC